MERTCRCIYVGTSRSACEAVSAAFVAERMEVSLQMAASCGELDALLKQNTTRIAVLIEYPCALSRSSLLHTITARASAALPVVALGERLDSSIWDWARQLGACDLVALDTLWRLPPVLRREWQITGLRTELQRTNVLLKGQTHNLRERIKELNCLYRISKLADRKNLTRAEFLGKLLSFLPRSWQYPSLAKACITLQGEEYASTGFQRTAWLQKADILCGGKAVGSLEICYLKHCPAADEGPFLQEERSLIDAIGKHIGEQLAKKEAEEALRHHQQLLEDSQAAIRSFSVKLLLAREEERKRIANTLHDELGSIAVLLGSKLKIAEAKAQTGKKEEVLACLGDIHGSFLNSVEGLKRLAKDLRPPNFEAMGLYGALEELTDHLGTEAGIPVDLVMDQDDVSLLDAEQAITVYRIAQEALNNALEHAQAGRLSVQFSRRGENARLSISDNGKGFSPTPDTIWAKTGLQGIQERCAYLGGTLRIDSRPGRGTEISVFFPLHPIAKGEMA